jgi:hyaluronan synthase
MRHTLSLIRHKYHETNMNGWLLFFLLIYIVLVFKLITLESLDTQGFFAIYSLVVSLYILSRFVLSYFYEAIEIDTVYEPTVAFAIPCKNEEANIAETIFRIAAVDYPKDKCAIVAINDGSTDNTLAEMQRAQKIVEAGGMKIDIVDWSVNRGKRDGMAEAVKRSTQDIIVFIDSDSFIEPTTVKELVKYFVPGRVAAVAGHTDVYNKNANLLTKMQNARYYVSYKAYKASEALFGTVTCCSGCCSAYRRSMLLEVIDPWLEQRFFGVKTTYGDDRSLTNYLLARGYTTVYAPEAQAYTIVPETWSTFLRQQLRWKKSWVRENAKAATFMWKKNPVMSFSFYLGFFLPLFAPIVVIKTLLIMPYLTHQPPYHYVFGLLLMSVIYGVYYYIHRRDHSWIFGILWSSVYSLLLLWQLPWAILTLRDSRWGTR